MFCEADNSACLPLHLQSSRDTCYGHRTSNLRFTNSALQLTQLRRRLKKNMKNF